MKSITSFVVGAVAVATLLLPGLRAAVSAGGMAPDFTLTDLNGQTHRLSDYKGKTVVLEWTNPGCPFVRKHYESGNMPRLQRAATADGVVWLSINSGARNGEEAARWLKEQNGAPTAYLSDPDGTVSRRYGAKTTPHMFVIGAEGAVVYQGAIDSIRSADQADIGRATNYVTATLAALKSGEKIARPNTQPYGCAVKY